MRHKTDLVDRIVENIKRSMAEVSAVVINPYFYNLEVRLAGAQPSSLVNYDETNLSNDPGKRKTLVGNIKPNSSENIKNGFRKPGLIPLLRDEILRQLPNRGIDANEADSSMEESFIGLLRDMH
ncbi:hypothetical protein PR048_028532 [Dryococelus australis]|uniref:Uncharacterized protein n=1 Tax=Dryococelus australis TaxID=614101 RepID=A0ABQ9GAX3_9NEOP|nr:hypothetical protein PR048_028532 [Dryococelus australis]